MQVQADRETTPDRPVRRFFERIADFFSPTLKCSACGYECKQRRCERSGRLRPGKTDDVWDRPISSEIECICPSCGESIWVPEVSTYYYPVG